MIQTETNEYLLELVCLNAPILDNRLVFILALKKLISACVWLSASQ